MPICRKCENHFPSRVAIDGKTRNLRGRKFCLDCSPFGLHNTRPILLDPNKKDKICDSCKLLLPFSDFYIKPNTKQPMCVCKTCANKSSAENKKNFKQICVDHKGGKCEHCGYDKYIGALEFHHKDPKQKEINISRIQLKKLTEKIIQELDKCLLLCANCHREEHARLNGHNITSKNHSNISTPGRI